MSILNISHSIHNRIRGPLIKQVHNLLSATSLVKVTNDEELIEKLSSSLPDEFLVSKTSKLIRGSSIHSFEMLGITHRVISLAGTIKLYVKTVSEERSIVTHLVSGYPDGPSRERLLNLQTGDIVMIQGNLHLQIKKVVEKKSSYYHGALKLFSAYKVGTDYRDFIQNTYSQGTVLGKVIGEFIATSDPFYEGYINVMTWRDRVENHMHVQTSRIMISKKAMRRFSFIKELMVGEKIMVDGLIDYMTIPNVGGSLLVVSAKEILRVDRIGKCNGEVLSNVST